MKIRYWAGLLTFLVFFVHCGAPDPLPRRHGFHRIDLPSQTTYTSLSRAACPFTLEYPDYGEVTRSLNDSCWVDIDFAPFELTWHLTYRRVSGSDKDLNSHFEDHRKLVYKHSKKATQIKTSNFPVPAGKVTFYEVYGNVGTPAYAFVADSTGDNLFMMSFYFQTALKNDSLAPIIDYMKGEVQHALQTLQWE